MFFRVSSRPSPDFRRQDPRHESRRRDIQGLRAIAVGAVVAFHAGLPVPGGFVGVDVFFVISGFVITTMLHREYLTTGRIRFARFYGRRFKRLTPALALMVAVSTVASVFLLSPFGTQQVAAKTAIGAMLLSANVVIARSTGGYFDGPAASNPLLNTWSLSVEEQFYLVFPALLLAAWLLVARRPTFRNAPFVIIGVVALVSFILAIFGSLSVSLPGTSSWLEGFYSPFTRAWEFAVGALLALFGVRLQLTRRGATLGLAVVGGVMLTGSLWVINPSTPFPSMWTLLPVGGSALVLIAGGGAPNPISRALATRPMTKIGDWSYSWYLWHWPFIVFALIVWPEPQASMIAAIVAIVPALASYYWLEQPLRNLGSLGMRAWASMVALTLGVPLTLATLLFLGADHGWAIPSVQEAITHSPPEHLPGWSQCDPGACQYNKSGPGPPLFLLGDSNAGMYIEAVVGAAEEGHRPLTVATENGCPFIDIFRGGGGTSERTITCRKYYDEAMAYVLAQPPGTVIIAEAGFYWNETGIQVGRDPHHLSDDPAEKSAALKEGLRSTIESLSTHGHQVILVEPTYSFNARTHPVTDPSCPMLALARGMCPEAAPLGQLESSTQEQARIDVRAVARSSNVDIISITRYQCPDGMCGQFFNEIPIYKDGNHISATLSKALTPLFAGFIHSVG